MPENEFEKKVSSEMQDLRFKPSENVWLRVEERIKTKKKRRILVFVFLFAGLALLGYWQLSNLFGGYENNIATVAEKKEDNSSTSSEETNKTSTVNTNSETIKREEVEKVNDKTDSNRISHDQRKEKTSVTVNSKDIVVSKKVISDPRKNKDENNRKPETKKTEVDEGAQAVIVVTSADSKKKSTTDETKVTDKPVVNTDNDSVARQDQVSQPQTKPLENTTDSSKVQRAQQEKKSDGKTDTLLKIEQTKQPARPIVKQGPSEKKWKWGLHITPGISYLSDHGFPINSQNFYDQLAYQNNAPTGTPPVRQQPSDPEAGFAFQAGAFAQRQLSPRINLSLGLQYGYYSNVLHIGMRRDSLLNNNQFASALDEKADVVYSAGGDMVKYSNHYHFIELPLIFQWQLNKNKTNPFVWSAGLTIGQMISTNAIMYDTAFNGIYYQNKKLLNKTQFSLSTGFSWTIANSKKAQWNLGPVVNVHLNRLVDNPFDKTGYVFFAGLRTAVLFNAKK